MTDDVRDRKPSVRARWTEWFAWGAYSLGTVLMGGVALESTVYVPNWVYGVPASLDATRAFLAARNPGSFFQIVAPLLIVVSLVAAGLAWRHHPVRNTLLGGLLLLLVSEAMTFVLFYPRMRRLLVEDVAQRPLAELEAAAHALMLWGFWLRLLLMGSAVFGFYLYAARASTLERHATPRP